jgi:hypothetical protein
VGTVIIGGEGGGHGVGVVLWGGHGQRWARGGHGGGQVGWLTSSLGVG